VIGEFRASTAGLPYPPRMSELCYSTGVGVDYYLWSTGNNRFAGTLVRGHQYRTPTVGSKVWSAPKAMNYFLRMPMFFLMGLRFATPNIF